MNKHANCFLYNHRAYKIIITHSHSCIMHILLICSSIILYIIVLPFTTRRDSNFCRSRLFRWRRDFCRHHSRPRRQTGWLPLGCSWNWNWSDFLRSLAQALLYSLLRMSCNGLILVYAYDLLIWVCQQATFFYFHSKTKINNINFDDIRIQCQNGDGGDYGSNTLLM